MRTREPILAIGACAVLALGAAGCGSNDKSKESSSTESGSALKLSPAAQKLNRISADVGGLTGKGKGKVKKGSANSLQPGDQLDISGLPQNIIQTVKQKTGLDVQVQCPPTVSFSPGSVFYCQLTTPDGTAYQVEVTQQQDGSLSWRVLTTQPTPPQVPGPAPQQLKDKSGKAKASRVAGSGNSLQDGDQLNLSGLPGSIETAIKSQSGLDVTVQCPATIAYSPGSVFYCKLYTSDGTAYDVQCTQDQTGGISWRVLVNKTAPTNSTSKLSSGAKKIAALAAKSHGLGSGAKPRSSANKLSDGQQADTKFIVDDIVKYFKEQKGIDVTATCPPQVQYALGSVFYCKLYLPDGTSYDVRVTWQQDGAFWEVITQPTPPPPPGGTTQKLKGGKSNARLGSDTQSHEGQVFSTSGLVQVIITWVKQNKGIDVTVDCPPSVTYTGGAKFYCKLMTPDGTQYDVEVYEVPNAYHLQWTILTQQPSQP